MTIARADVIRAEPGTGCDGGAALLPMTAAFTGADDRLL